MWVDCYSDWPIVAPMDKGTTASHLIAVGTEIFAKLVDKQEPTIHKQSIPKLLNQWGKFHIISTPHYHQSNRKAEGTVKVMKKTFRAEWTGRLPLQVIPCTYSKGKGVGTEPSFSLQACSWIHTSRTDAEWSPTTNPDTEWGHWGTTAHIDPTQGTTISAEEVTSLGQACLQTTGRSFMAMTPQHS